jgi:hypothetical protein
MMKVFIFVFALALSAFPHLGETQNATEPEVIQMIAELKAAVPDCAVNIIILSKILSFC